MSLTDEQIVDLGKTTQRELGRMRFSEIATKIQNYEVMGRIMKRDKIGFQSGTAIQHNIMVDDSGSAKQTTLFAKDVVNIPDVMQNIVVPWRHTTGNWGWERREMLMNRGRAKIVSLSKVRRTASMISVAAKMEHEFWTAPSGSSDTDIYGVPYWCPRATGTPAFNASHLSGFSDTGGLSKTDFPRWRNWAGGYTNVTKTDLITKMRTAIRKCQFKPPVDIPDYRKGSGARYRIYCNETTIQKLEDLGEAQNENLGRDLAPMDGKMAFRSFPVVWVPQYDSDTDNPVYGLDFNFIHPVFLKGDYLRESEPAKAPESHNTFVVHVDLTWNVLCDSIRSLFVLSTAADNG